MNRAEYAAALQAVGHFNGAIVRTVSGARYYAQCECGYRSTTRNSKRDAVEAIEHHRGKELRNARQNGVLLRQKASG